MSGEGRKKKKKNEKNEEKRMNEIKKEGKKE